MPDSTAEKPQIPAPPPDPPRPSRNAYAKQGWGSRMNFQHSYGLKPGSDEDWAEGNRILDAFIDSDMEERREEKDGEVKRQDQQGVGK